MEAKKKSAPSTAAGAGAAAPPPNGYFSSVFSSSPAGNAKDAKLTDLYAMLNKQSSRGQNGNSITGSSGYYCQFDIATRFRFSSYVKQSLNLFVKHLSLQMIFGIDVTVEV
jgi:hypothetical protein